METKIPFEFIAFEEAKLFSSIKSSSDIYFALQKFYNLLNISGWTQQDYDAELLNRIDSDWEIVRCHLN